VMMHRLDLKALRNIHPLATVSTRAFNVVGTALGGLLHQSGTSQHRATQVPGAQPRLMRLRGSP
jgi:hypothetical protein